MSQRLERLADQIMRDLAVLIRQELKDPRLGMVTISAVKLSRDLGYADVYVTVLGQDLDVADRVSVEVLQGAAGLLRAALGRGLRTRVVPRLRFHYDEVLLRAQRLSSLISQAVAEDAARHDPEDAAH